MFHLHFFLGDLHEITIRVVCRVSDREFSRTKFFVRVFLNLLSVQAFVNAGILLATWFDPGFVHEFGNFGHDLRVFVGKILLLAEVFT